MLDGRILIRLWFTNRDASLKPRLARSFACSAFLETGLGWLVFDIVTLDISKLGVIIFPLFR